jgi:hypothetical protein
MKGRAFEPQPCTHPTLCLPGTTEKIAVLRSRVEHGLTLHHPLDLRPSMLGDGRGLRVRWDEDGNPCLVAVEAVQGQEERAEKDRDPG